MSLEDKLDKIRSPNLESQKQKAIVLAAVESTLQEEGTPTTSTAYFAALLSLLKQSISSTGEVTNDSLAASSVYLLDVVTSFVPAPLLCSKFNDIIIPLLQLLSKPISDALLVRTAIGCLESLLVAQDSAAWALTGAQISPRTAVVALLHLAVDARPKVRKRATDALKNVLQHPPPSPSVDHPAAALCAETALKSLAQLAEAPSRNGSQKHVNGEAPRQTSLIHSLQMIKAVANSSGGWPARNIEQLCRLLLSITKRSDEYLVMAVFDIFEVIFESMAKDSSSAKLSHLMESIMELRPFQNDSQLLPPWLAVLSRAYDVSSQIEPAETFQQLPKTFDAVSAYFCSSSHNIRVSTSEFLISLLINCVPGEMLLEPSVYDEKISQQLCKHATELLNVKFQSAWMEVFNVIGAFFDSLKWRAAPLLDEAIRSIGDMRSNEAFNGKKEADLVLGKAITAMGSSTFLRVLPLNILKEISIEPGRAWLLPILRDHVSNSSIRQFSAELIPLSEVLFQKAVDSAGAERTMETKIFETLVQQIWSTFPGFCDLPTDITEGFDQTLAEMLAKLLYKQSDLRFDICKGLQMLVDSNQAIIQMEGEEDLIKQRRVTKAAAQLNIDHMATFSSNILAVLFNVYSQTLPQHRGYILNCINSYLGIIPNAELDQTFSRVTSALEAELANTIPQNQSTKQKHKQKTGEDQLPLMSHTLMDLIITMSVHLPRESFATLFTISAIMLAKRDEPQLQKKAYKMIPRLATSPSGRQAIQERIFDLQKLLVGSTAQTLPSSRKDRLATFREIVTHLPDSDLSFIPTILAEVVAACKETNQRTRGLAFDLLVAMGERTRKGGTVISANVIQMADGSANVTATIDEYFTMISAGLIGGTSQTISATVTALSRCLFEFKDDLKETTLVELFANLDAFLTSPSREIVRSVLGFVKVSVISLPTPVVLPRLPTLIPNLMRWSSEHKDKFKTKVKHIMERMIRRFGVETVERYTPHANKKLIQHIRKMRDRQKRKKASKDSDESSDDEAPRQSGRFESEYDNAIYDSSSGSEDEGTNRRNASRGSKKPERGTFIMKDDDEPLDLLSKTALANISTTKPSKSPRPSERRNPRGKVNIDGKLVIGMDLDDEAGHGPTASGQSETNATEGGVDAYVEAIAGKHAVQRGQRGKLKIKNQRSGDEMEVDEEEVTTARKDTSRRQSHTGPSSRKSILKHSAAPKSKYHNFKKGRRGLGMPKARGEGAGRV
ncbi:MAG: hypothetical protein M1814_001181 [Vezdaea aestivalis]|nr:MAG: hypothetical protein M1814_001181 [Vezdaea aestivalis]